MSIKNNIRFREFFVGSFSLPDPYLAMGDERSLELARFAYNFYRRVEEFKRALEEWKKGRPERLERLAKAD